MGIDDFKRLQKAVDDRGITYGGGNRLPSADERKQLADIITGNGKKVGEGSVVRYIGYVNHPCNSNVDKGETVNCTLSGAANNDIHIDILNSAMDSVCKSVTVEIIPHCRPAVWSKDSFKELKDRPFRFTGHLFFDGAHKPCKSEFGDIQQKRVSVWEIHPVYKVDVCRSTKLAECRATDEFRWIPLHLAINAVHEEDDR